MTRTTTKLPGNKKAEDVESLPLQLTSNSELQHQHTNSYIRQEPYVTEYQKTEKTVKTTSYNARINPDSKKTLWFTVILIVSLGMTSFLVSFNGLLDVATWVGLPPNLRWAVPVFIDISILAYSMAAVIHKARNESVRATWVSLGVFTFMSVIANAVHALSTGQGHTVAQSWIGAVIAAAAPIAVFAATEELSRLAFRSPEAENFVMEEEVLDVEEFTAPAPRASLPVSAPEQDKEPEQKYEPESTVSPSTHTTEKSVPMTWKDALEQPVNQAVESKTVSVSVAEPAPQKIDVEDGLIEWVTEQINAGENVTGAMVGEFLGKSSRTGANRLKTLKEEMPALFEGAN